MTPTPTSVASAEVLTATAVAVASRTLSVEGCELAVAVLAGCIMIAGSIGLASRRIATAIDTLSVAIARLSPRVTG